MIGIKSLFNDSPPSVQLGTCVKNNSDKMEIGGISTGAHMDGYGMETSVSVGTSIITVTISGNPQMRVPIGATSMCTNGL